ncbi:MAG: nitroreductase family protein [Bradymonadales bacterium]
MKNESVKLFGLRRTQYAINDEIDYTKEQLTKLVSDILAEVPSAFYSKTQGVVLLLDQEHEALWDIVLNTLKPLVPAEQFSQTEAKIASFKAGRGTVLFFTDEAKTKGLQDAYPLYAANFPPWALQENGMLQYAVWVAFAENGIGASLQHYNPLIDDEVKKRWGVSETWTLLAQMPFGKIVQAAGERGDADIEKRLKVFG